MRTARTGPWLVTAAAIIQLLMPAAVPAREPDFQNSIGMAFVLVPAGTFTMGSPVYEAFRNEGETPHRVTITRPFYLQTTEVTLGQWRKIMGKGFLGFISKHKGPDNLPVTRICRFDVRSFLEKLNTLNQGRYRLPTEAEWEYAARAGTTSTYPWGESIDCTRAMYGNMKGKFETCRDYAKSRGLPLDGPAPVKSYAPNPWGLYDMHGNVWEWCQDWFEPYSQNPVTDPQGPAEGDRRIRRGGSWFGPGYSCRSANRAFAHPASRLQTTGFRIVREVEP